MAQFNQLVKFRIIALRSVRPPRLTIHSFSPARQRLPARRYWPVRRRQVVYRSGLLALREIEDRLRLADRLADCLKDPRAPERDRHSLAGIIRFRMMLIAAGYEDGDDADHLRTDPIFQLALERLPSGADLCSQSTDSRLENLPDRLALLWLAQAIVEQYCASFRQVPRRIVLDADDTFDRVHGGQQLRLFNAFHDDYGFQPIVVFDGEGRFVTPMLRPGKRPSGREIAILLRRLIGAIRAIWPRVCESTRLVNRMKSALARLGMDSH